MTLQSLKHIHRLTAFVLLTAILFYLFFQVNKRSPFVEANPFAEDPYDAVGSIAIQVALLTGLLSYARVLRWRRDEAQAIKSRLILRGDLLVLLSITITLATDAIAVILNPQPLSTWGAVLRFELGAMFLLSLACGVGLWLVSRRTPSPAPPSDLTPADAIDDLWSLLWVPVEKARPILPMPIVRWVTGFSSDRLFARLPWLDPRRNAWRFTALAGLLVGVLLLLATLLEGLPPNLGIGLLVASIFISVELAAALVGLALFGGYLGLRPNLVARQSRPQS